MAKRKKTAEQVLKLLRKSLRDLEKSRVAIEREEKKLVGKYSKKASLQKFDLQRIQEEIDDAEMQVRSRIEELLPPITERLIRSREIVVRGFWDRYPKKIQTQRKQKGRFKSVNRQLNKGPTAFDVLMRDYKSFSDEQREHLQLRITGGLLHESLKVITPSVTSKRGLSLNIPVGIHGAEQSITDILVRAEVINTPSDWKRGKPVGEIETPLVVEWWTVIDETEYRSPNRH